MTNCLNRKTVPDVASGTRESILIFSWHSSYFLLPWRGKSPSRQVIRRGQRRMKQVTIENPIINSPFEEPKLYHEFDAEGSPTGKVLEGL
jgi:hypothetical protein